MDLKTTLQNDMKSAMKAGEPVKTGCLRMLIAEIKKREIDKRSVLDEGEIQKTVSWSLSSFSVGRQIDRTIIPPHGGISWHPRADSNCALRLRRPTLCPLSYGGGRRNFITDESYAAVQLRR